MRYVLALLSVVSVWGTIPASSQECEPEFSLASLGDTYTVGSAQHRVEAGRNTAVVKEGEFEISRDDCRHREKSRGSRADRGHRPLACPKGGLVITRGHPVRGDEMRALRKLQREQEPKSPFVFTSERGSPFTTAGFARMVERAGVEAKLGFPAHPHMLRHACGFALANKGHDTRALQAYLGHRNIQHTVRYTELSPDRFKDFWR